MQNIIVTADIFWAKVSCGNKDECWPWTATVSKAGYGQIRIGDTLLYAHRVAWFLAHGEWPSSWVLHKCDNPPCVNPSHLFVGTRSDNMKDAARKGRICGERSHSSKLTAEDVKQIRQAYTPKQQHDTRPVYRDGKQLPSHTSLAKQYHVSEHAIWKILKGKTWKELE